MNMNIAPLYTSVHVRQTSPALCWTVTRPTDKSSTPLFMNEHEYRPSIYERPRPTDKSSTPRGGGACTRDTSYIHSLIVVDLQLMHKQDRAHHPRVAFLTAFSTAFLTASLAAPTASQSCVGIECGRASCGSCTAPGFSAEIPGPVTLDAALV